MPSFSTLVQALLAGQIATAVYIPLSAREARQNEINRINGPPNESANVHDLVRMIDHDACPAAGTNPINGLPPVPVTETKSAHRPAATNPINGLPPVPVGETRKTKPHPTAAPTGIIITPLRPTTIHGHPTLVPVKPKPTIRSFHTESTAAEVTIRPFVTVTLSNVFPYPLPATTSRKMTMEKPKASCVYPLPGADC